MAGGKYYVRYWCGTPEDPKGQQWSRTIEGTMADTSTAKLEEIIKTKAFKDQVGHALHELCDEDNMVLSGYMIRTDKDFPLD